MSEYKFMQGNTSGDIVVQTGEMGSGNFSGVLVKVGSDVYPYRRVGQVSSVWITSSFTEITPQEAKDKYDLVLYRHETIENNVCCQTAPITDEDEMPVVFISGGCWEAGERWNLRTYSNFLPIYDNNPTPESKVDWSEAPVWADAYGQDTGGLFFWLGRDNYRRVGGKRRFDYGDEFERDKYDFKIIENRPPRTIAQILGISSLSVNSEIAKNQKTIITTPKPTKTQRVINRAFEDIFTTTVTFKNPEWGALLFETIEPRLTYEQKLDLVCAVYGVHDEGDSDEEHF
jgi:hypothetical protein